MADDADNALATDQVTVPEFTLATCPCLVDTGRFRWEIHHNGTLFQSSADSYATEADALAEGEPEHARLMATQV